MLKRSRWQWFAGIALVIGSVPGCTDSNDRSSCGIVEKEGISTLKCTDGTSVVIAAGDDGRDGVDGTNGVDGANGTDGVNGTDGDDGANGVTSLGTLVSIKVESAGEHCATGGQRVDYGQDDDASGILDASEVDGTKYVCNGANGANGTDGVDGTNGVDGKDGVE
jgi:hypothetical protein